MLDVSRGPVRDALLMLEGEGLVRVFRHRGAVVVELSLDDLGEVYSLRSAIESIAIPPSPSGVHEQSDLDMLDQGHHRP